MKHTDPYLPAKRLGISESNRNILIGLAADLAANALPAGEWNMHYWETCICGNMIRRSAFYSNLNTITDELGNVRSETWKRLFVCGMIGKHLPETITQQEAARACYNFLTRGEPNWEQACQSRDIA